LADGSLVLTGRAADVGQSRVRAFPSVTTAKEITITLDPRFRDRLSQSGSTREKTFTLELRDGESAAVCTTDDGYGYVIMPLARDR